MRRPSSIHASVVIPQSPLTCSEATGFYTSRLPSSVTSLSFSRFHSCSTPLSQAVTRSVTFCGCHAAPTTKHVACSVISGFCIAYPSAIPSSLPRRSTRACTSPSPSTPPGTCRGEPTPRRGRSPDCCAREQRCRSTRCCSESPASPPCRPRSPRRSWRLAG